MAALAQQDGLFPLAVYMKVLVQIAPVELGCGWQREARKQQALGKRAGMCDFEFMAFRIVKF
jgi:hypothetical protein